MLVLASPMLGFANDFTVKGKYVSLCTVYAYVHFYCFVSFFFILCFSLTSGYFYVLSLQLMNVECLKQLL